MIHKPSITFHIHISLSSIFFFIEKQPAVRVSFLLIKCKSIPHTFFTEYTSSFPTVYWSATFIISVSFNYTFRVLNSLKTLISSEN